MGTLEGFVAHGILEPVKKWFLTARTSLAKVVSDCLKTGSPKVRLLAVDVVRFRLAVLDFHYRRCVDSGSEASTFASTWNRAVDNGEITSNSAEACLDFCESDLLFLHAGDSEERVCVAANLFWPGCFVQISESVEEM